ncbi:MAG TPA: hypothetical protein VGG99_26675 [Acetobacteraceae bacterium]|jgi:hypothetical protein
MNVEYRTAAPPGQLDDRNLMLQFESIGDSCEFGLVQRQNGAEPLGLLRFSGVPVRHLIRGLENRFEGAAEPDQIRPQVENGEYMIKLWKYDFIYHAQVREGAMDPTALHAREVKRTRFLLDKLIADLENPAKILVFRQNEPLLAHDLVKLRAALARYSAATLLWVQEAMPGHLPGTAELADDRLLLGYVRWLAPRENAHQIDHPSWLSLCRQAHALWRPPLPPEPISPAISVALPEPAEPFRSEIIFGEGGNSETHLGFGWSAPENGFTWSIEDASLVTLDVPAVAERYVLDMEVTPFQAPPAVPGQRLHVSVNGAQVFSFDTLPRGRVSCIVPGHLVAGRDMVEILLEHPDAARPADVLQEDDVRRLAIAFNSLSLMGLPG